MTTKEAIIYESLKLFSTNGYDAVSTRTIARAVGASDAVIYKHFRSKKDILDTIADICKKRYFEKRATVKLEEICWKNVEQICMGMFEFQTTDEWIVMFRKMLIIEQFKNNEMGYLYKKIFIDAPLESMEHMFRVLMKQGYMKEGNPRVYAMELYAPFFMYHTIDGNLLEIKNDLREHVTNFRCNVITEQCYLNEEE